ncbi:molybdopterin-dependent oxidoreductase [Acerihabitans sp. TG2]|uniref:molybdopterin-dependent oxidoreductase n=1 Tax=Acerihabitans sp. TG2 TaxID=3096008 RepID=UPI002B23C89D|nr:molybdopterin-dependent oxidoreductase [Acerihabitans sp. TG2]MEA9390131.1 molybdopterin-dependent oxidoreductase [Acerihabitans sp. TG2]
MSIKRYPHLAHWGAFTAVVDDGKLIRCEPFAHDTSPSAMLDSIVPLVYSDLRIRRPAVRRSWLQKRENSDRSLRGKEEFVEIDWDLALDLVAQENRRVREQYGADGLFAGSYGWSSAGRFHHARSQVRRFYFSGGGAVDQQGNYSWGAAQFFLPYVIGTFHPLTGKVTEWRSVAEHCDILLAFGGLALKNAQVASGGAGQHTLKPALEKLVAKGIPVINISPMRDDCPAFVNAEWIPVRPNTDVALMLALAYEIQRLGADDKDFLQHYCVGYEQLTDYLQGRGDGIAKTPHWASAITGIPATRIERLARQLIGVRSFITCSYSIQRAHRGEQPYWMMIALSSMLGQVGLPGGGFSFGQGSMNCVGNERIATPAPASPSSLNAGQAIPVARIADMLLHPGTAYTFDGQTHTYPDIHLIHWAGGNPFHHHQQLNRLVEGWRKPDTVIVQDIVWTPAARMADIVLPVTTTLERNDIGGSSRDRFIFAMHQAIPPQHQARNDVDIFSELAQRLGHRDTFTQNRTERQWLETLFADCAAKQHAAASSWPSFDEFWQQGYVEIPMDEQPFVFFEDFRHDPQAHALNTPSGKIELYSSSIAGYGYPDFAPHPQWREPIEWLGSPVAKTWPLHCISIQPADRLHSQLAKTPQVAANNTAGKETLYMHPQDAAARQITDRSRVEVRNDRGRIYAGVQITDGVTPGVVIMSTGAWFDPGFGQKTWHDVEQSGNVNVLTLDIGSSPLTQGPNAMSCLVDVVRV